MSKNKTAASKSKKDKSSKVSVEDQKSAVKEAKANLTTYLKENKIKRDSKIPSKHKKKVTRLEQTIEKAESVLLKSTTKSKDKAKDKKVNGTGRSTKYTYPKGMDDPDERKKFRTKKRAEVKKAEKEVNPDKTKKKKKKIKEEEPNKKIKTSKSKEKSKEKSSKKKKKKKSKK